MRAQHSKNAINKRMFMKYTSLFLMAAAIIFIPFIIQGKTFIHEGDGFHQHYPFFKQYLDMIRNFFATGDWQSWDWSIGLGADTLLTYGYYVVGDPFVYLGLLFPQGSEEFAFHAIMLVRIWAVGLSFLFYARKMKFKETSTLAGTMMYAFSHYVIYNVVRHPFFIHPLIWFPLLALGIEKIFRKESGAFFALIVGLSAISNFYFFYMLTLMAFLYAFIRYFTYEKQWDWKVFGSWLLKFSLFYIIGLLISAVIFLPQVAGFLSASRSSSFPPISLLFYPIRYYGLLILNLITPGTIFWAVGGFSIVAILTIPFLARKKNKQSGLLILLAILSVMLLFPFFGSFMNGLSGPYNRFTFVFPFYLSITTAFFLDHLDEMTTKDVTRIKKLMIGFTVIYGGVSVVSADYFLYLTPLVIGWLVYYVLNKDSVRNKKKLILALVVLNMITNALNFYLPHGKHAMAATEDYGSIDESYTNVFGGLEEQLPEDEWYRIGATTMDNHVRNHYAYLDVNGLNSYASLTNGAVSDFSILLENAEYQMIQPLRNGIDNRRVANQALGIRYILTATENKDLLASGYEVIHEKNDFIIAETEDAAPFAYVENEGVNLKEVETMHPVVRENLLEDSVIVAKNYPELTEQTKFPTIATHEGVWEEGSGLNLKQPSNLNEPLEVDVTEKNSSLTLHFEDPESLLNQEVFLYIEGIDYQPPKSFPGAQEAANYRLNTTFNQLEKTVVQSNPYSFSSYYKRDNILMHLHEATEINDTLTLEFQDIGHYQFDQVSVVSRSNVSFAEGREEFELEIFTDEYLKGRVESEGGMLVTNMPYSAGWSAYVDGEKVPTEQVNVGFIGILLTEGLHKVEFVYETPLLKAGLFISLFGFISLAVAHKFTKK